MFPGTRDTAAPRQPGTILQRMTRGGIVPVMLPLVCLDLGRSRRSRKSRLFIAQRIWQGRPHLRLIRQACQRKHVFLAFVVSRKSLSLASPCDMSSDYSVTHSPLVAQITQRECWHERGCCFVFGEPACHVVNAFCIQEGNLPPSL